MSAPISGLMLLPRAFDVPQLDAKQHDVDLADLGRVIGCAGRHQMDVAAVAANLQPLALHGGKMGAACDEGDVGTGPGQRRTESASDAARADNRNTHGIFLC